LCFHSIFKERRAAAFANVFAFLKVMRGGIFWRSRIEEWYRGDSDAPRNQRPDADEARDAAPRLCVNILCTTIEYPGPESTPHCNAQFRRDFGEGQKIRGQPCTSSSTSLAQECCSRARRG
jgi:hypothetical protein